MNVQVVGCSHHGTSIAIRERLAFGRDQTGEALDHWRRVFRNVGGGAAVDVQPRRGLRGRRGGRGAERASRWPASWPASTSSIRPRWRPHLYHYVGEAGGAAPVHRGRQPGQHGGGRAADPGPGEGRPTRRPPSATTPGRCCTRPFRRPSASPAAWPPRRPSTSAGVSIPSVAVADFAQQIFERFDDKQTLVIGGRRDGRGDAPLPPRRRGAADHGRQPAFRAGRASWPGSGTAARGPGRSWPQALAAADLVISTTAAGEPDRHPGGLSADRSGADAAAAVRAGPGRAARLRSGHRRAARRLPLFDRRPAGRLPAEPAPARQGAARPPCGSSTRRPTASWPTSITAPPAR